MKLLPILIERISDDSYLEAIQTIKNQLSNISDITNETSDEKIYKVFSVNEPIETSFGTIEELYFTIVDPLKDDRWKRKSGEVTPDGVEVILFPSPIEFKQMKKQKTNPVLFLLSGYSMNNVITHELTHALNKLRSKGALWAAKGKKQFNPETSDYAQSTEEMQARIIPVINDIKSKMQNKNSKEGRDFASLVAKRDAHGFISSVLSRYGYDLYFNRLDDKTKKRYIKRLIDIFQTL